MNRASECAGPGLARVFRAGAALLLLGLSLVRGSGPLPPPARKHPWALLACLAIALAIGCLPLFRSWRQRGGRLLFESRSRWFYTVLFLAAVTLYGVTCRLVFHGFPRLDDDVAALFQARIFARGALSLPLPPNAEFFECYGVLGARANMNHWMGMYPPGWPLLLTPGVWLGVPWMINPVLGGFLVLMTAALAREWFDARTGRIAGLMALGSPYVTVQSATHLSHVSTALWLMIATWSLVRLLRLGHRRYGWLAGTAWGWAFLCRPPAALCVGAVLGIIALCHGRDLLKAWRGAVIAIALAALSVGVLLAWQGYTTGNPRLPGHKAVLGDRCNYGFVAISRTRTHTPAVGWDYTLKRMRVVNDQLLGWPIPALLIVLLPFLLNRARPSEWSLLGPWLALLAFFMAYWYWEECFPARYQFSGFPMLIILGARGLTALHAALPAKARAAGLVPALMLFGSVFSATVSHPFYLRAAGSNGSDVEDVLEPTLDRFGVHHAVVFMRSEGRSSSPGDNMNDHYATGFMRNALDLNSNIVFARDLKERNSRLIEAYPGRRYYWYSYLRGTDQARFLEIVPEATGLSYIPIEPPHGTSPPRPIRQDAPTP